MSYKIKSRIWIECNDQVVLGEGRVRLLKSIETEGSLSKAAKALGISYKKAWQLLDSVNKSSEKPIIVTSIGGKGGGGAELTAYGKSLVTAFEEINKNCWRFLDEELKKVKEL